MSKPLWTSDEIAAATGGALSGPAFAVGGVSIDTRSIETGDLFVALAGARDGHEFVPQALAGGRDPAAATEVLREMLYDGGGSGDGLSVFATFLFTHNAQVALLAFALGFAFCIPSLMLLIYNGATLGAFLSLYLSRGLGFELGGWLLIHGVTELFAVMLAGAAGIRVGWSLAFPGALSRLDSLAAAGRTAGAVMGGVVVMLFFAGLLEGFGRQLITHDLIRYGVAGATAVLWGAYFYGPRREVAR